MFNAHKVYYAGKIFCRNFSVFHKVPADVPEENLNYASVHFTKKSSEPLYSDVCRTPKRRATESEDTAEYALVVCRTAGAASSP